MTVDMTDNPVLKCNKPIGKEDYQPRTWVNYEVPLFPSCRVAVVANAKGERKLEKAFKLKMTDPPAFAKGSDASANVRTLERPGGQKCFVVAVNIADVVSAGANMHAQLAAFVAHEASHICDDVFDSIGETYPGTETRAYLSQWVVEAVCEFYYLRFEALRQYHEH